jgi:hypothetical protein
MAKKNLSHRLFDFFASLKLAVLLIISLATILAVGTFYEAAHGTADAQRVIYKSWFVSLEMLLLIINLTCAAIDRLPWRKYHIGFVVTHAGIITLIIGSLITQKRGIDGNLAIGINETANSFTVDDNELHIYQSVGGKPYSLLVQSAVDFDSHSPKIGRYDFKLVDDDKLHVTKYIQKAIRKVSVKESIETQKTSAVQFRLHNDRVDVTEWLGLDNIIPPFYDLGPATVTFIRGSLPQQPTPKNQILIYQDPKTLKLNFAIFSMRAIKPTSQGILEEGKDYSTGWMNIQFRVEHFYKFAESQINYAEAGPDDKESTAVIEAEIGSNKSWFELESPHEIKSNTSTYFVAYVRKKYNLGFEIRLDKFKMQNYGGSLLPMSYESTVTVSGNTGKASESSNDAGGGEKNPQSKSISMNEPLKFNSFTLYQSSFEQNERGEPTLSVFAVNYDPGRAVKYAGSLGIVFGIAIMFYIKPRWSKKKRDAS